MERKKYKPIFKWVAWVLTFLAFRVSKSAEWAAFLSFNLAFKRLLFDVKRLGLVREILNPDKLISRLSNTASCALLYTASLRNKHIPKDYVSVYLLANYYGLLRPDKKKLKVCKDIELDKRLPPKVLSKTRKVIDKVSSHKEVILYSLIFGQFLSNYLTPTKYRLNHKYLSGFIKNQVFNPIWLKYSLGVNYQRIDWLNLVGSYLLQNVAVMGIFAAATLKKRLIDKYYELIYTSKEQSLKDVVKNYVMYCFHKGNSVVNFVYFPNLIAILLVSLTSPILRILNSPSKGMIYRWYKNHTKLFFKGYIKTIGFTSAFLALYFNTDEFIPDFGYSRDPQLDTKEQGNIRVIPNGVLHMVNIYLFRLIVLSKWRILKENHPNMRVLGLRNWNRIETFLMCVGVYKLMNLNDDIKHGELGEAGKRLRNNNLIKYIDKIM